MKSLIFLKAAYIVAWVTYLGYLARILLRMSRVQNERRQMETPAPARAAAKRL